MQAGFKLCGKQHGIRGLCHSHECTELTQLVQILADVSLIFMYFLHLYALFFCSPSSFLCPLAELRWCFNCLRKCWFKCNYRWNSTQLVAERLCHPPLYCLCISSKWEQMIPLGSHLKSMLILLQHSQTQAWFVMTSTCMSDRLTQREVGLWE